MYASGFRIRVICWVKRICYRYITDAFLTIRCFLRILADSFRVGSNILHWSHIFMIRWSCLPLIMFSHFVVYLVCGKKCSGYSILSMLSWSCNVVLFAYFTDFRLIYQLVVTMVTSFWSVSTFSTPTIALSNSASISCAKVRLDLSLLVLADSFLLNLLSCCFQICRQICFQSPNYTGSHQL